MPIAAATNFAKELFSVFSVLSVSSVLCFGLLTQSEGLRQKKTSQATTSVSSMPPMIAPKITAMTRAS